MESNLLQAEQLANDGLADSEKADFVPQSFDALRKVNALRLSGLPPRFAKQQGLHQLKRSLLTSVLALKHHQVSALFKLV